MKSGMFNGLIIVGGDYGYTLNLRLGNKIVWAQKEQIHSR